jgi:hypothetical protein
VISDFPLGNARGGRDFQSGKGALLEQSEDPFPNRFRLQTRDGCFFLADHINLCFPIESQMIENKILKA